MKLEDTKGSRNQEEMPPTRGHDLKLCVDDHRSITSQDAPHTGARLETSAVGLCSCRGQDAPHTGARLETFFAKTGKNIMRSDAPHTGARLETCSISPSQLAPSMPPTRGHDLKHWHVLAIMHSGRDAPHTGARLETDFRPRPRQESNMMPPTRGHDLKPLLRHLPPVSPAMPPTRGHDLKQYRLARNSTYRPMPPTRGHDLKRKDDSLGVAIPADAPHTGARLETALAFVFVIRR